MKIVVNPDSSEWIELLQRPGQDVTDRLAGVQKILSAVRSGGDQALLELTSKFDGVTMNRVEMEVPNQVDIPDELADAIQAAYDNISRFHAAQKENVEAIETQPGVTCWRKSVPIEKVGLYVPGGSAPLFSSLLMLGIPAKIAGCKEVVVCTPPNKSGMIDPAILYTCRLLDISTVYAVGGAQAIAAMAYGTESIPSVYKIFGPGNSYVTLAKQLVQTDGLAIDMPAGPSEVLVITDDQANPAYVAADLLSQAEHGPDSQVILVSTSESFVKKTIEQIEFQLSTLPRAEVANQAISNSRAFVVKELSEAFSLSNAYAPEHLILAIDKADSWSEHVTNAGSVFLGNLSCESMGDYASGTNHTLPTHGYARNYSGVSLDSFIKKITFQEIKPEGMRDLGPKVEAMAAAEGLEAHKRAVTLRLNDLT